MTTKELLTKYPDEIPVLELAKFTGLDASGIRRKVERMNGKLDFDKKGDILTKQQLQVFLPTYLAGRRPITGKKKRVTSELLKAISSADESQTVGRTDEQTKPDESQTYTPSLAVQKLRRKLDKKQTKRQTGEGIKSDLNNVEKVVILIVATACIFFQASHFAAIEREQNLFEGAFGEITAWGIAIAFESLVLVLTYYSDKKNKLYWVWLISFAIFAIAINLCFYGVIENKNVQKVLFSIALPASILAMTHLFNRK